jgi:hypothetical protein
VLEGHAEWGKTAEGSRLFVEQPLKASSTWCNACGCVRPSQGATCGPSPATAWYKCAVCVGFELCGSCQETLCHPHPLYLEPERRDRDVDLLESVWHHRFHPRQLAHTLDTDPGSVIEQLRRIASETPDAGVRRGDAARYGLVAIHLNSALAASTEEAGVALAGKEREVEQLSAAAGTHVDSLTALAECPADLLDAETCLKAVSAAAVLCALHTAPVPAQRGGARKSCRRPMPAKLEYLSDWSAFAPAPPCDPLPLEPFKIDLLQPTDGSLAMAASNLFGAPKKVVTAQLVHAPAPAPATRAGVDQELSGEFQPVH